MLTNWREWGLGDWVAAVIFAAVLAFLAAYAVITGGVIQTVVTMAGTVGIIVVPAFVFGLLLWIARKLFLGGG